MMLHTYFSASILLLLLAQIDAQSERNASVSLITAHPYFVATEEGKNVSILCRAISIITSCRFIIPGEPQPLDLIENDTRSDNYEYFGDGFESGQCGITIMNIKKENGGNATCIVDLNEHLRNIRENIPITITKELPQDNKTRTIIGIVIFTILTVIFNIILFYCYMQGQNAANKTKRALTQSHTNPSAANITASEQILRYAAEKQQQQQQQAAQQASSSHQSVEYP